MNPENIPAVSKRFTESFCDLNRDKILKMFEDIKVSEQKITENNN